MLSKKQAFGLVGVSCFLALGGTFQILACALPGYNWYPLISSVFYLLAPLPFLLGALLKPKQQNLFLAAPSGNAFVADIGTFISAFFLVSALALCPVLAHNHVIKIGAVIYSLCGGIIIYASLMAYAFFFLAEKKEESMSLF